MRIEIHAVPFKQDGYSFLQVLSPVKVLSPVQVVLPIGQDQHRRVKVNALWDTGATNTCIPMKLAVAMGIPLGEATPLTRMRTTDQSYYCQFWIEFPTGEAVFVPEAVAVPDMRAKFIIGMELIRYGTMLLEPMGDGAFRFTFSVKK